MLTKSGHLNLIFKLIIIFLLFFVIANYWYIKRQLQTNKTKAVFETIYANFLWGKSGEGSGPGSTIDFTANARAILRNIVDEYSINTMLDAPCGSFHWMPLFLRNVSTDFKRQGKRFRYHGVDVVESVIESSKAKYSSEDDWMFSVCDISADCLPNGYDLVFSRDSLMHLSYEKVFNLFLILYEFIYFFN